MVFVVGSDHFRAHTGAAYRAIADGAIIRVSDRRSGEVLGWLMRRTPHELAGREHLLPDPHDAADDLRVWDERPDLSPEPLPWVVRREPKRQAGAA